MSVYDVDSSIEHTLSFTYSTILAQNKHKEVFALIKEAGLIFRSARSAVYKRLKCEDAHSSVLTFESHSDKGSSNIISLD